MNTAQKIKFAKRFHRAKLEAVAMNQYTATYAGGFILCAVWVYYWSGLDIPGSTWILIAGWLNFLAVCQAYITFNDRELEKRILRELLEDDLRLRELSSKEVIRQLGVAITYRTNLQTTIRYGGKGITSQISDTLARVDEWLMGLGRLARRVDHFKNEATFQSSQMFELRQRIADLESRASEATDSKLVSQLRETIAGRRHQLRTVQELNALTEHGVLSLEHAVASIGTVCAQLALVSSNEESLGGGLPLATDINAEIEQIDSVLTAFERVRGLPEAENPTAPHHQSYD